MDSETTANSRGAAKAAVGGDVQSICGKCGETWHVVVALAEHRIAMVECGLCGKRHRYRTQAGAGQKRRPASGSGQRSRSKRPPASAVVEPDLSRPQRPFCTSDTYRVGDRVSHDRFGDGVVQAIAGAKKVQVLFESGLRTLVHARSEP